MKTVSPALTPMQDQQLGEIENYVQSLFHEKAEQWARSTGFVQRSSKITGSAFAQTLVFGFLNQPEASYTDWPQTMELQGIQVSPQAIEERMTAEAAALMGRFLEEMVAMVVSGQECHLPVLQSCDGVYLPDGTVLTLPDELRDSWRGSGETGGEAGLRVQVRINWSDGQRAWSLAARCSRQRNYRGGDRRNDTPAQGSALCRRSRLLDPQKHA